MTPIETATLKASAESAKGFLSKIFGPALDEVGLILQDNIKIRRLKNQLRNLEKVKKIVEKENISIQKVNLKVLVPYLENVSLEEDEILQELWANLFTNYIDKDKNLETTVYPSILSQVSTLDIEILNLFSNKNGSINLGGPINVGEKSVDYTDLSNLLRLGLVEEILSYYSTSSMNWNEEDERKSVTQDDNGDYRLTTFGTEFISACNRY